MRRRLSQLLLLIFPLFTGSVEKEFKVYNLREFDPPEKVNEWYKELQDCVGIKTTGPDSLRWFFADSMHFGGSLSGAYFQGKIILKYETGFSREHQVKHELLHHLIKDFKHENKLWGRTTCLSPWFRSGSYTFY